MSFTTHVQSPQGTAVTLGPFSTRVEADSVTLPRRWLFVGVTQTFTTLDDAKAFIAESESEVFENDPELEPEDELEE